MKSERIYDSVQLSCRKIIMGILRFYSLGLFRVKRGDNSFQNPREEVCSVLLDYAGIVNSNTTAKFLLLHVMANKSTQFFKC